MRRSTAQAVQILCMHLLGDAGSPYLIGVVSNIGFWKNILSTSSLFLLFCAVARTLSILRTRLFYFFTIFEI